MSDENKIPSAEELNTFIKTAEAAASDALENGNQEAAAKLFNEILSIVSNNPVAHNGIGLIAVSNDKANVAEHHFRKAVDNAPDWAEPHLNLGLLFLHGKRTRRAIKMLTKALELSPEQSGIRYLMAQAFQSQGKKTDYENELRRVIADDPNHAPACNDLGIIEVQHDNHEAAINLFERAANAAEPVDGARTNMGNIQLMIDDNKSAEKTFDLALKEKPNAIEALIGKSTAQRRNGNLEAALLTAEQAASLAPENAPARNSAGTIYREMGVFEAAESNFIESLELSPNDPGPRSNLALLNLLKGKWDDAWPDYEARTKLPGFQLSWGMPRVPAWEGESLDGRTVLVLSEQGFGDSIQFARFMPMLAEQAENTLFAVQPELAQLLEGLSSKVTMISPNQSLPDIDVHSLLLSLPGKLGITGPDKISGAAYLKAPSPSEDLADAISNLKGYKVGINWRGAPRHTEDFKRSIQAKLLSPILEIEGVSFVSLDFSDIGQEISNNIIDVSAHISDFSDSAALIDALDLVISVDTATVHLAGALGKDCWAMIPFVPDWRWLLDTETTPWYDSVKLFRQPERNDWDTVIARIKTELGKAVSG